MDEDTSSGEWTNYDGWCGAEWKHIGFKMSPSLYIFNSVISLVVRTYVVYGRSFKINEISDVDFWKFRDRF